MVTSEQLKRLFIAYRDKDDLAFYKEAGRIIEEELAGNHHSSANQLRKALGNNDRNYSSQLMSLPKERRSGSDLITFLTDNLAEKQQIIFCSDTEERISRLLEEHVRRKDLQKYCLNPKTKLLFWGPPGCGKTFAAHYLSKELCLPLGVLKLSSVISSYLGDTATHIQKVFDLANSSPMILLLDEIDAIGKSRDDQNDIGELKRTVNSFLQSMDGFTSKTSVIIAATNHQYMLDLAVWRRFDDVVYFPLPGNSERQKYLKNLLNGVNFEESLEIISKKMESLSFSDINKIIIESIKTMILDERKTLTSKDVTTQLKLHSNAVEAAFKKSEVTFNADID